MRMQNLVMGWNGQKKRRVKISYWQNQGKFEREMKIATKYYKLIEL